MRTFRKLVYLSIAALFISFSASAQDGKDTTNLNAKVDAVFTQYDKSDSPGCALGVIRGGKLIYARGYGMANLEHGIANGPKLVYDIGSTSKQFTAASIVLLAQQGKLSLDDDVRKHISELPAYKQPVTIRHLLHHTSGLRDYLTLFSLAGVNFDDMTTEKDALDIIVRQKGLNFTPGAEWLYSNSGYFLLSIIIKRASGKSFAEFAKENIFDPLGMKHTLILDNHKKIVPMRATGYSPNPRANSANSRGFQTEMSNFEQTGDGAVQTSIEDLLLWDQNFYEPKVGGKTFLEQMHAVGSFNSGEKLDYASGLFIDEYKGLRRVSHGGSWAGYRAELARFPDQKFSVACLCNLSATNPSALAMKVADLYLADQLKVVEKTAGASPAAVMIAEEKLKEKAGVYRSLSNGELRRITLRDGKLRVDAFTQFSSELKPTSETQFSVVGQEGAVIEFKLSGGKSQLSFTRNNRKPDTFERVEAFAPSADSLKEFVASYYSEELDTTYRMSVEQGSLIVIDRNGLRRPLTPTIRDSFAASSGQQFEYSRDNAGKISGFAVHAGRIRNVRFSKLVDSRN